MIEAVVLAWATLGWPQHELSQLAVTGRDPLFTTYAAPVARSQFVLDEGYQLKFSEPERGVEFTTDNGGTLGLAFRVGGVVHYQVRDLAEEPVIIASYSDLVKLRMRPFPEIEVEVFFQVYSSRIAIEELAITNSGAAAQVVDAYAFLHHPQGLRAPAMREDARSFVCSHEEPPDWWTLAHGVPYCRNVTDILVLDAPAQAYGGYASLGEPPGPPLARSARGGNYCVEWGTVHHADGSLCTHQPPLVQQLITRADSQGEILTEDAPKWGDPDPNIPGNGFQGCELGNFLRPPLRVGDSVIVVFTCNATGEQGAAGAAVGELPAPSGVRIDLRLAPTSLPPAPRDVHVHFAANHEAAVVSWVPEPGCRYTLYRRTSGTPGRYDLIAQELTDPGYLDLALDPDSSYRYVLVGRDQHGTWGWRSAEVGRPAVTSFFADVNNPRLSGLIGEECRVVAVQRSMSLQPGETKSIRLIRGVIEEGGNVDSLAMVCQALMAYDMEEALREDEAAYARIPRLAWPSRDHRLMYWSAFSMMRQCMMPPEGECSFNYYLFSREPTWGWGHGGQVFHESLAMLAYAYMDPVGAQNSQRLYAERMNSRSEWPDGYIPYRVGPYLNELLYWANEYSSSAPWFNWETWQIFQVTHDTSFVRDMYDYGVRFHNFWLRERDDDRDGLCEWGGDAFLESVRDYNVIWDLLGGYSDPHNANKVEALDLNCELVMEEKALASMAALLGKQEESAHWERLAQARADAINALMWDPETRFYYHVDKHTHTFTYRSANDLRRKELIGFLPLWAGVANQAQARYLLAQLRNPDTFGRPYGVPLLAHSDPYDGYDAHSVYPEWNFLVFRGLLAYGFYDEARELAERLFAGVIATLRDYHDFYESYSCDAPRPSDSWLHTYIWTGVVARMLLDLDEVGMRVEEEVAPHSAPPVAVAVFPNPFNSQATFVFPTKQDGEARLSVYDLAGREVARLVDQHLPAGLHRAEWDGTALGRPVASGLYLYVLKADKRTWQGKIVLVR
jgi:hypothetical protein